MKKSPSANGGQGLKNCSAPSHQTNKCTKSSRQSTTKTRRSQRSAKRKSAARAARREVAVYDDLNLLGIIKIASDGKSTVYDPFGKRLGLFSSFQVASAAFNKSPVPGEAG